VTRIKHVSARLTLTEHELDELIEAGANIRGLDEWDMKKFLEAENVSHGFCSSMETVPTTQLQSEGDLAGTTDQSPSGRDFGKAIELIRQGLDDGRIIEQIVIAAGNRMKNGHAPGHPSHLVYAQGTVSRARSKYKSAALPPRLNWKGKIPIALPVSPASPQDQIAQS
jgi:hypothetical protein